MSKKPKAQKKHRFKYAEPTTAMIATAEPQAAGVNAPTGTKASAPATTVMPALPYIRRDLRRLGVLAASLAGAELVLWYAMSHTGLSNAIYSLFR